MPPTSEDLSAALMIVAAEGWAGKSRDEAISGAGAKDMRARVHTTCAREHVGIQQRLPSFAGSMVVDEDNLPHDNNKPPTSQGVSTTFVTESAVSKKGTRRARTSR